jgi:hypothetical protein
MDGALEIRASDPKVDAAFGIHATLPSWKGALPEAKNRRDFSSRCACNFIDFGESMGIVRHAS